ncbi:MAG: prolyl oligopeptidase family serine peptidase [Bacteroidetes bacterium]|nr:prolyl oligopeptidase family serine peptidase [Fibrella sp.]
MRHFPFSLLLLIFVLSFSRATAQDDYQKRTYTTRQGKVLPYRILYPKNYDKTQKYPIVVLLHGAGERGNDNEKQLTHGSNLFLNEQNRANFPAIVIFPQCPAESYWASMKIERNKTPITLQFPYAKRPNWPLKATFELVRQLTRKEGIDKSRVYIMGLSMGGMGTFEALSRAPKSFAAAVPVCGAADTTLARKYAGRVPLWVFHGDADAVVPVTYSRQAVATLRRLAADGRGLPVTYTEYPGVNHNSWDKAFAEPELLPWLFAQRKR